MNKWQSMVREFHHTFGHPIGNEPCLLTIDRYELRQEWTRDELDEMDAAMADGDDIEGVADGIVDAIYFLLGTAVEMGIDLDPLFTAVHIANMAKLGGGTHPDGKTKKPTGWMPPDIAALIEEQRSRT